MRLKTLELTALKKKQKDLFQDILRAIFDDPRFRTDPLIGTINFNEETNIRFLISHIVNEYETETSKEGSMCFVRHLIDDLNRCLKRL
jgi:hypothetical protein